MATLQKDDEEYPGSAVMNRSSSAPSPATRQREPIRWCSPSWKRGAWGALAFTLVLLTIVLLATSLKKLKSTEYGVQYNVHSKQLDEAARIGGLHLGPPGYKFIKFPSTFITVDLPNDTCVSQDGLRVAFSVTFQYQIPPEWLVPAVVKYRDFDKWADIVEAAGNSAVQHSCSEFQVSNFQNKRGEIQSRMEDNLRLKLDGPSGEGHDGVYARAISLQLSNVKLPAAYTAAIDDKQAAEEDITLAQNERIQAVTKAGTALLSAGEEARIINNTAVNDADIILTEALIKAQEATFAFETEAGVIVSVKQSLNLTNQGVLAYMSNRLYAQVDTLKVSAGEPARLSRKDEL